MVVQCLEIGLCQHLLDGLMVLGAAPGCPSSTRGAAIARSYVDSHIVLIVMSCHTVQHMADSVGCPQRSHGPGSPCNCCRSVCRARRMRALIVPSGVCKQVAIS